MKQDFFKSYYEAVKKILDGTPVKKLDDIRWQCNEAFMKAKKRGDACQNPGYYPLGYQPELVLVTFAANAENKILMGADPAEFYSIGKAIDSDELRESALRTLRDAVQQYLN